MTHYVRDETVPGCDPLPVVRRVRFTGGPVVLVREARHHHRYDLALITSIWIALPRRSWPVTPREGRSRPRFSTRSRRVSGVGSNAAAPLKSRADRTVRTALSESGRYVVRTRRVRSRSGRRAPSASLGYVFKTNPSDAHHPPRAAHRRRTSAKSLNSQRAEMPSCDWPGAQATV